MTLAMFAMLGLLFSFVPSAAADTISIHIEPEVRAVTPGSSTDFQIVAERNAAGPMAAVGGFDLTISFPEFLLSFDLATFGFGLGDPNAFEALTNFIVGPGHVTIQSTSLLSPAELDALQPSIFDLATLSFTAVGSGNASLGLSDGVVVDAFGNTRLSVPEPRTTSLVGLALLSAVWLRRRRG